MNSSPYLQQLIPAAAAPPSGNPPGALSSALLLAAKQKQQASQAASALARKSHPQTLGQPPQRQDNSTLTSQPPQLPPSPVAPPPQAGGTTLAGRLGDLTSQLGAAQKGEGTALQSLQAAMAAPQPQMPSYAAPQMQQANPGLALGAALAALFAPKYSQGAIGALGVDQANREKAYDQATEAAKTKWDTGLSSYNAKAKSRQEAIEDAERLDTAFGRNIGQLNTQVDTELNREVLAQEKKAQEDETIREHHQLDAAREVRRQQFLMTYGQRQRHYDTLAAETARRLGISQERADLAKGALTLSNENLRWQMKKFGTSEAQIADLQALRLAAAFVQQTDRDQRADKSDAFRAVMAGQHDMNNLISQLARTPGQGPAAAAIAQRIAEYQKTSQGQKLASGLQAFGVSGTLGSEILNEEANVDAVIPSAEGTQTEAPPVADYVQAGGNQGGTGGTMTAEQMLQKVQQLSPQISGQNPHGSSAAPGTDPVVQQFHEDLPQVLSVWPKYLEKFNGDPRAAWNALMPHFSGSDPREVNMLRREVFKQGARGGSNQEKKTAPLGSIPSLKQTLTGAGISPELLAP